MDEQQIKQKNFEYALGKGVCIALLALTAVLSTIGLMVLLIFVLAGMLSGSTVAILFAALVCGLGYATYRIFSNKKE